MQLLASFLAGLLAASAADPKLPLPPGRYTFEHRFTEQPEVAGTPLTVVITGDQVEVISESPEDAYGVGVIDSGTLMWHPATGTWIVGHEASDRLLEEVGGCSDGPAEIDLERRIYWTC